MNKTEFTTNKISAGETTYNSLKTSVLHQGFFYHLCLDKEGKITSSFLYKKGFNSNLEEIAEAARKAFKYSLSNEKGGSSIFESNISIIDREITGHNQKVDFLNKCFSIIQYIAAFFIDLKKYTNVSMTQLPQSVSKRSLTLEIEVEPRKKFENYKTMKAHFQKTLNFEQGLAKIESQPPRYYFWYLKQGKADHLEIVVNLKRGKFEVLGKEFEFPHEASNYILAVAAIEQHPLYAGEFDNYRALEGQLNKETKIAIDVDSNEYYFCKNGKIYPLEIIMDGFKSGGSHIHTKLDDFINSFN